MPTKTSIYWTSGFKTECTAGAAELSCLSVSKSEDLNTANWEVFYSSIEGFEFEKGFLKKIKVKEEILDPKSVPADASSIKYTLIKELDKQPDKRVLIEGKWLLSRFNNSPINRSVVLPKLEITLNQMRIGGSGGCNSYSSQIETINSKSIKFGNIMATEMFCSNNNIENEYFRLLEKVNSYEVQDKILNLYDSEAHSILTFIKDNNTPTDLRLNDIWVATRINGKPIDRISSPTRLEIHLKDMKVMGNNGCNQFNGNIISAGDNQINFGPIASTKKMCAEMEVPDNFDKAMNEVSSYLLEDLTLIFLDSNGNEVLSFLKVD